MSECNHCYVARMAMSRATLFIGCCNIVAAAAAAAAITNTECDCNPAFIPT